MDWLTVGGRVYCPTCGALMIDLPLPMHPWGNYTSFCVTTPPGVNGSALWRG